MIHPPKQGQMEESACTVLRTAMHARISVAQVLTNFKLHFPQTFLKHLTAWNCCIARELRLRRSMHAVVSGEFANVKHHPASGSTICYHEVPAHLKNLKNQVGLGGSGSGPDVGYPVGAIYALVGLACAVREHRKRRDIRRRGRSLCRGPCGRPTKTAQPSPKIKR